MGKRSKLNQKKSDGKAPIKIENRALVSDVKSSLNVLHEPVSEDKTHEKSNLDSLLKNSNIKTKAKHVNEEDKVTEKDIDEFCDDLDEEANLQFENWVTLLEAKLSGGNKSLVSSKETNKQSTTNAVSILLREEKKSENSIKAGAGTSSAVNVISRHSSTKKLRNKTVKNELKSDDCKGSYDHKSSSRAENRKRKHNVDTERNDPVKHEKK